MQYRLWNYKKSAENFITCEASRKTTNFLSNPNQAQHESSEIEFVHHRISKKGKKIEKHERNISEHKENYKMRNGSMFIEQ